MHEALAAVVFLALLLSWGLGMKESALEQAASLFPHSASFLSQDQPPSDRENDTCRYVHAPCPWSSVLPRLVNPRYTEWCRLAPTIG